MTLATTAEGAGETQHAKRLVLSPSRAIAFILSQA